MLVGENTNKGGARAVGLFNASDAAEVCDAIAMSGVPDDDSPKKNYIK